MNLFRRKYYLNPKTLQYERVKMTKRQLTRFSVVCAVGLIALAVIMRHGFERYYPTPKQLIFEKENQILRAEYASLNTELQEVESQLSELRNRDDRFYRSILSLDPVSSSIREAGTGGSKPNLHLRNLRGEPGLVMNVSERIDNISNKAQIQTISLETVYEEAINNQHYLACRPSIHPLSPADPFWLTSGYGFRKDPFTHRRTAHHGIDLGGPYGLDIHATGDGTVVKVRSSRYGYGKEVVLDHGFGFKTIYAHLQDIHVKVGQKLKRGEVLGTLGNTGRSTGPHLHYEVRENNRTVNPMYFFYENLSAEEYGMLASRVALEKETLQAMP
ncbi:MAG: peptidoglycan DD-metalloendopeptidase family protein [Bacteroidota bacterium]